MYYFQSNIVNQSKINVKYKKMNKYTNNSEVNLNKTNYLPT